MEEDSPVPRSQGQDDLSVRGAKNGPAGFMPKPAGCACESKSRAAPAARLSSTTLPLGLDRGRDGRAVVARIGILRTADTHGGGVAEGGARLGAHFHHQSE